MQVTQSSVKYAAEDELLNLAFITANARNLAQVDSQLERGFSLFMWLQALQYSTLLTTKQSENIWLCLIQIGNLNNFPVAPNAVLPISNVIVGGSGNTVINNITYSDFTPFSNPDVDTGTETVDTFPITSGTSAAWYYTLVNGTNRRSGIIQASWLSDGSQIGISHSSTDQLGSTLASTLSVTYSSGNILLNLTVASDNWSISGKRLIL